MNRRPSGSLLLSRAIPGFLQYKAVEGLSPTTLQSYKGHLKLWLEYTGDVPVKQIDAKVVQGYFLWLRTEYQSRQVAGRPRSLAPKTIRNFHITLSAFYTWASREFELASPMKAIPVPKYEEPPVEPFTKEQIEALLKACESCKEARPIDRRRFTMRRATGRRDQAVVLTLLDTGLRASELSALKVGDVDLKSGRVLVKHGRLGGAKDGKGRTVFLGKTARRALWRYIVAHPFGTESWRIQVPSPSLQAYL